MCMKRPLNARQDPLDEGGKQLDEDYALSISDEECSFSFLLSAPFPSLTFDVQFLTHPSLLLPLPHFHFKHL